MVQCRWQVERRRSHYNAIKETTFFFSTKFGIISCYSNKGVQEKVET